MKRNGAGAWCGYTAVNPGHRLHGVGYMDIDATIDVHGGLTYSDLCHGEICHIPQPGDPDDVWWFGFDCNHGFDIAPAIRGNIYREFTEFTDALQGLTAPEDGYRDVAYVREQVTSLARQLAAVD